MHMDSCGCLWDWEGDILNIVSCEKDKEKVEKAQRIAWRLAARRCVSFREAWNSLWERIIVNWISGVVRDALK